MSGTDPSQGAAVNVSLGGGEAPLDPNGWIRGNGVVQVSDRWRQQANRWPKSHGLALPPLLRERGERQVVSPLPRLEGSWERGHGRSSLLALTGYCVILAMIFCCAASYSLLLMSP